MNDPMRFVASHRARLVVVAGLVVPCGVAAGFVPFRTSFTNVGAALVLVALIEAVAILGSRLSGVIATLSAAIWFDFFLTVPYDRFTISHSPDLETTISLIVVGCIATELAARSRRHRHHAGEEANYVAVLHDATVLASTARSFEEVAAYATHALTDILDLRSCHFEHQVHGPPFAQFRNDGSVVHVGLEWPVSDIGIPGPLAEIPCRWRGRSLGRFILTPTPGLAISSERRIVAVALVNIITGSLHDLQPKVPAE